MRNIKFEKLAIVLSVLLLQPMMTPGSFALAKKKKSPPKAYSFIVEGGKASQGECDGEKKIPRLKKLKEYAKAGSYMGSELQTPEIKGKPGEEMWKHFFRAKPACNTVLAKTPSSLDTSLQNEKKELPPDDSADSDEDSDQRPTDGPDSGPDTE